MAAVISSKKNNNHIANNPTRESSLFHLISELGDGHALLQEGRLLTRTFAQSSAKKPLQYHRIALPLHRQTPNYIPRDYICIDRHLTVPQYFNPKSSDTTFSCSYLHCTEVYKHRDTDERISVHIYLNTQGQYFNTLIKEPKPPFAISPDTTETKSQFESQEICDAEETRNHKPRLPNATEAALIRHHEQDAIGLAGSLLREKAMRFNKAQNHYTSAESTLARQDSKNPNTLKTIQTHLNTADKCLRALDKIAAYNDFEKDPRKKFIENKIAALTKLQKTLNKSSASIQNAEVEETPASPASSATEEIPAVTSAFVTNPSEALYQHILETHKTINDLMNQKDNPIANFEAYQKSMTLKEDIFEWWFFHQNSDTHLSKKEKIESIETSINNINPFAILGSCIMHLKIKEFKKFFKIIQDKIIFDDFVLWIECTVFLNDDAQEQRLEVFHFLFRKSSSYRNFILVADLYTISDMYTSGPRGLIPGSSPLYAASATQKYKVFALLLEQGYNPNGVAASYQRRSISLLRILTDNPDPAYTQQLLDRGAKLNTSGAVASDASHALPKLKKILPPKEVEIAGKQYDDYYQKLTTYKPATESMATLLSEMTSIESDLLMACKRNNIAVATLLAKKSTLEELILAFSFVTTDRTIGTVCLPRALDPNLVFADSQTQSDKIQMSDMRASKDPTTYYIKFILHPHPIPEPGNKQFDIAKVLYGLWQTKCCKNPKMIDEMIKIF